MTVANALDAAGRRRSPATLPGYHAGPPSPPRNKGQLYPADPPTVEEIIAVMRQTPDDRHGARLRALIVALWRGGLRVQEALALGERDLDPRRGSVLVRQGKVAVGARSVGTPGAGGTCRPARPCAAGHRRCAGVSDLRPETLRAARCRGLSTRATARRRLRGTGRSGPAGGPVQRGGGLGT